MIKKSILAVLTVLTILFSFAACSDTESEQTDAPVTKANDSVANVSVLQVSDCCEDNENSEKDCCHEKAEGLEISDCCHDKTAESEVSDCCQDNEDSKDCCQEKTEESQIPDCCGG